MHIIIIIDSQTLYMQIKDGKTGYFPLYKARSLQEKEDHTSNELSELKRLMKIIVDFHQEEVYTILL